MLVVLNIESMFKQVNNEHKDYVRKLKLLHGYFQLRYVVHSEDKLSSYDNILHIWSGSCLLYFRFNEKIQNV